MGGIFTCNGDGIYCAKWPFSNVLRFPPSLCRIVPRENVFYETFTEPVHSSVALSDRILLKVG